MITAITAGLVFGLSAGLAPGPLLALVLRQSLSHGRREGFLVALAPLLTDLPILILAVLLIDRAYDLDVFFVLVSFAGSVYVIKLAWETARSPLPTVDDVGSAPRSLSAGVLANGLSPHPYLFWLTLGAPTIVTAYRNSGLAASLAFIAAFYVLLVGSKALLAVLIGGSRQRVSPQAYRTVMRALAVALGLFAVVLVKEGWQRLAWLT
ncbi:MAG: LysE family transporter [Acidobacteriota bacterium]